MFGLIFLAALFGGALLAGLLVPSLLLPTAIRRWAPWVFLLAAVGLLGGGDGGGPRAYVLSALFVYAFLVLARTEAGQWRWPTEALPLPLWGLMLLAVVSISWSPLPWESTKRVIQFGGVALVAAALVRLAGARSVFESITLPLSLLVLLSIVLGLALPAFGQAGEAGFRGITTHKNVFGQMATMTFVCGAAVLVAGHGRWRGWTAILAGVAGVLLSGSASAQLIFVGLAGIGGLMLLNGLQPVMRLAVVLGILAPFSLLVLGLTISRGELPFEYMWNEGLAAIGRSNTLTGRTQLWALMWNETQHHPWLGIGYGGFWNELEGPSRNVILQLNWGPPTQAHNGYLDVYNEMGVPGILLLLALVVSQARNLRSLWLAGDQRYALLHTGILLAVLTYNIPESSLLRSAHLLWFLLALSIADVQARSRGLAGAQGRRMADRSLPAAAV